MFRLVEAKFNMTFDAMKPGSAPENIDHDGHWVSQQDDAGDIIRVWVDNPATPNHEAIMLSGIPCQARGFTGRTPRAFGNQVDFNAMITNLEPLVLTYPAEFTLTTEDRVTNIRNGNEVLWREETMEGSPPTIYVVKGVIPSIGPFGRHIENVALIERSEVQ